MQLFDSHLHLGSQRFDTDRQQVLERARDAGMTRMLTCGSDVATSTGEVALAGAHEGVYAAVGVHGHEAESAVCRDTAGGFELDEAVFERITQLASAPGVVAIGEIGLDYHYDLSSRDVQRAVLARQLRLACELGLPVVLHNRESDKDMRRAVDAAPAVLMGVLHCFLSTQEMADWAAQRGLYLGIAGPITFKSVKHLEAIVRGYPRDRLLIETDSPYLAPHPRRGKRNEPAWVVHVAERLADILDLSLQEVVRLTTGNACRLFGVPHGDH